MPAARLAPSIREDLSLAGSNPPKASSTAQSRIPSSAPDAVNITSGPTTLRKSYRRILSLSPGLRVRMRTLFLPQLLPVREADVPRSDFDDDENEGEPRVVLCVEMENPSENVDIDGFEVAAVKVDVGGKGGKAIAELVCQPEPKAGVFPLRLRPIEQYNLLYAVTIASMPDATSKGDDLRPVSITLIGRPYMGETFPTSSFPSRWNCTLDLASFYASLSTSAPPAIISLSHNRLAKPITSPVVAIAGDKRYSLASLNSDRSDPRRPPVSSGLGARSTSYRGAQPIADPSSGLLVSVKILPQPGKAGGTVRPLEPFSIEVFVHNRTEAVRRFTLSIPGRDDDSSRTRGVYEKRRRRRRDEPEWGADDPGGFRESSSTIEPDGKRSPAADVDTSPFLSPGVDIAGERCPVRSASSRGELVLPTPLPGIKRWSAQDREAADHRDG